MNLNLILIVDDEPDICDELRIYLKKKGYDTILALNGQEGFDAFMKHRPLIVLTDYMMPAMNGIELLKKIKAIDKKNHVVLMSGVADIATTVEAMKSDAFDFLAKPIDLVRLLEIISTIISKAKANLTSRTMTDALHLLVHEAVGTEDSISILHVNTDLDESTAEKYKSEFHQLLNKKRFGKNVVFDMQLVKYINNIGLNLLIDLKKELDERNHYMYMCDLQSLVKNYLSTLGYSEYFNAESTLERVLTIIKK